MTRIYLSGPITGLPEEVYTQAFERAEQHYKSAGFEVVNPVKIGKMLLELKEDPSWEDFIIRDLEALRNCTHIAMLEGWEQSKGAKREYEEAQKLGIEILRLKFFK